MSDVGTAAGNFRPDNQTARLAAAVGDVGKAVRAERQAAESFGDEINIVLAVEISAEPRFLLGDAGGRITELALGVLQAAQPDDESGIVQANWTNSHTETFCFP